MLSIGVEGDLSRNVFSSWQKVISEGNVGTFSEVTTYETQDQA